MLIGEVAKLAGLSKDGIRHYESLGLIKSSPKQAGSKTYRDYDPSVLHTIEQIRGAQHFLRLSLQEIGPLFRSMEEEHPTDTQRLEYLEERLAIVRKQLASLREIEEHLCGKIDRLRTDLSKSQRRVKLLPQRQSSSDCRDPGNTKPHKPPRRSAPGLGAYSRNQV
jgi:MerR family copper efflux transcriptional regulator